MILMKLIILGLVIMTPFLSCATADQHPCIQIFYDAPPPDEPNRFFGRIHALFIQNLLGHFPEWHQIVSPVHRYAPGQMERCEANIYLGTYFKSAPPSHFFEDFARTDRQVMWLGYHIWELPQKDLERLFGIDFKGLTRLDHDLSSTGLRPHFFRDFHYKGEVFEKYGEWDPKDPKRFVAAFELVRLERKEASANESHVLAWAEHTGTHEKIPYVIVNKNHWYMAESPFAFATEKDRYLIFTDLLFDFLKESSKHSGPRQAFVRFEDIHPNLPLWQLDAYTGVFEQAHIPFSISLIPIFADPLMVQVDDRAERFVTIADKKHFRDFLSRAQQFGGSIIFHGITHQYHNKKNPFNGLSGDDFEFWDGVNHQPIPEDSVNYVLNRVEDGLELLRSVGISPSAWLTPHYQASPLDFIIFGQVFSWNIGRVVYFPFRQNEVIQLPHELSLFSSEPNLRAHRFETLKNLEVTFPPGLRPSGQFFPFEIWGDVFGQRLIPENLGNIQPFLNEQVHKTQDIDEMIECAKRNRVLRDHWASFFIHPVLIQPQWEEGLGEYPGDGRQVLKLLTSIQSLGYEFIDLKTWVHNQPKYRRPPFQEDFIETF